MVSLKGKKTNVRRTMKGGFTNSSDIWSFAICKMLIDDITPKSEIPAGVKRNWREALNYLASLIRVSPEDLYNKMVPSDLLSKVGRGYMTTGKYANMSGKWRQVAENRETALKEGKAWDAPGAWALKIVPLPGKPMTEEQKAKQAETEEEREMHAFFHEPSYLRNNFPEEFDKRAKELEEGASEVASEECYGHSSADPGLCLAAHKGTAKRIARRERELKERARRQALNAVAQNNWNSAQGPLLALAAKHANKPNNFRAAYNGVKVNKSTLKKSNTSGPAYQPGTGTWLTGRNVPKAWPPTKQEKAWEPKYGPNFYKQQRGQNWESPPQQEGDWVNGEAIKEIMEQTYADFPKSGPNKKLPQRPLYEAIAKALKDVRYEKGYEDPITHQPKLDVYDQALSRAKNWRNKGKVDV